MKRPILALLAMTALIAFAPAAAAADTATFKGLAAPKPSVGFTAKIVNGDVVSVKQFRFYDIVLACDNAQTLTVNNQAAPLPKMIVNNNGRFGDSFTSNNGQKVDVSGKFTSNKRAEGKLRVTGDFVDQTGVSLTNCDSGKVSWVAK